MERQVVIDLEMCKVPRSIQRRIGIKREIIQIGAVLLEDGIIRGRYSEYVKPEYGHIDCFIKDLTGIHQSDLYNAKGIEEVLKSFMDWAGEDAVFVSWSMSDRAQLKHELEMKNIVITEWNEILENWEDCQKLFGKTVCAENKRYSLREAVVFADIETRGAEHDALADAYNTALLYVKLKTEGEDGFNTYYQEAHQETMPDILQFSLGDLFRDMAVGECVSA